MMSSGLSQRGFGDKMSNTQSVLQSGGVAVSRQGDIYSRCIMGNVGSCVFGVFPAVDLSQ